MRYVLLVLLAVSFCISGCATGGQKVKEKETIAELNTKVDELSKKREQEKLEFEKLKADLEAKLQDARVKCELQDRGLVIILADNILFDSGKADVKSAAYDTLDTISVVLIEAAKKNDIGIEGHTDNEPIKKSGWRSNRELSSARANNVCHYLSGKGIPPDRLTTIGYGQYRPISSNDTIEGKAKNRRVEIVILPQFLRKSNADIR